MYAMGVFDHSRPSVAAGAVGVARRALEESIQYAKERVAMGQPIWRHQAIGHMVADMAMEVEAARLLVWKAAWAVDSGTRNTTAAAFAKAYAADKAMKVCVGCGAGLWRLWLYVRVSGRKADAGHQDLPDLRRHQPDSTQHHCA